MIARCLWCTANIEVSEEDKAKMVGRAGVENIKGWYHNGLGFDPMTGKTEFEFYVCPECVAMGRIPIAFRRAREVLSPACQKEV